MNIRLQRRGGPSSSCFQNRLPVWCGRQTTREAMKRVLVIEDDKDIVELVKYNLEKDGYQLYSSADGATGLAQVRKTPPDLLILDLMLPKVSGLEICKEVRKEVSLTRLRLPLFA